MRGKKFVAWALSAIMAAAPLSACAQQQAGGQAEEEWQRAAMVATAFARSLTHAPPRLVCGKCRKLVDIGALVLGQCLACQTKEQVLPFAKR